MERSLLLDKLATRFDFVAHQSPTSESVTTFMSQRDNLCVSFDNLCVPNQPTGSNVQIANFQGVFLDKLAAGFYFVAH